jgi:hypothetical protein
MPLLTRFYIKTALLYLIFALVLGATLLINQPQLSFYRELQIIYFHLFMLGWITQLIFGVAWWMFPIFSLENPRGNEKVAWTAYVSLNVGLIFRVVAEGTKAFSPSVAINSIFVIAALLQLLAIFIYIIQIWPRVGLLERRQQQK